LGRSKLIRHFSSPELLKIMPGLYLNWAKSARTELNLVHSYCDSVYA